MKRITVTIVTPGVLGPAEGFAPAVAPEGDGVLPAAGGRVTARPLDNPIRG